MILEIINSNLGYAIVYDNNIITQSRDINTLLSRIENRTLDEFDNEEEIQVIMPKRFLELVDQKYKNLLTE